MPLKTAPRLTADTNPDVRPLDQRLWVPSQVAQSGIVNDYTGNSFKATVSGSNLLVSVGAPGDTLLVQGYLAEIVDSPIILDAGAVGTAPSASQSRTDWLVARLDRSTWEINIILLPGSPFPTPVGGGGFLTPPLLRNTLFYDLPLYMVRRRGTAALITSDLIPNRIWAVNPVMVDATQGVVGSDLVQQFPIGTQIREGQFTQTRQVISGVVSAPIQYDNVFSPLREWDWGGAIYNASITTGSWATPPGAERTYPVTSGHLYQMVSHFTLQSSVADRLFRVSAWMGGGLRREIGGTLEITSQHGEVPMSITGFWIAGASGNASFGTRFATNAPGRINLYSRFASPSTTVIDHGLRTGI